MPDHEPDPLQVDAELRRLVVGTLKLVGFGSLVALFDKLRGLF